MLSVPGGPMAARVPFSMGAGGDTSSKAILLPNLPERGLMDFAMAADLGESGIGESAIFGGPLFRP